MKKGLVFACVLSLFALPVLADGFYAAGDVGEAKWKIDSESDTDIGFGIAVGYKFNNILAAEVGYRDLGGIEGSDSTAGYKADLSATQISVLASYPFNDAFSVYGRLGAANMKIKASAHVGGLSGSGSDSATKALYGVGVRYAVGEETGIRLEYSSYAKYEELTVSALFFGLDVPF